MYFKRKIDSRLESWRVSSSRKPLILRGARQVGKTETVRLFAKKHFQRLAEVNFERETKFHSVFEMDLKPTRILSELEIVLQQPIKPGETLLFFDEIQSCSRAITSLRYFFEELPALHVIAAGSLLEFVLDNLSMPVGRVTFDYMYPLCFSEFLMALDHEGLVTHLPHLDLSRTDTTVVPRAAHELFARLLREYFIIGGMPQVIAEYKNSNSFSTANHIQDDILAAYREDINKYAKGKLQLSNCAQVFHEIFRFVGKTITYTHIAHGDNAIRTKHSVSLLEQAMVIHRVRSIQPSGLPLGAEPSRTHFKCVFFDIGLGNRSAGVAPNDILYSNNLLRIYEGRLAEQFVGQQLLSESQTASEGRNLYCWVRAEKSASAEVDYVIVRDSKAVGVEVKSGKSGSLKSLHLFIEKFGVKGICLQEIDRVATSGAITFMPVYTVL